MKHKYIFGQCPDGYRFLIQGETIERGDQTYHVSDSTYIECIASVGRKADEPRRFIRKDRSPKWTELKAPEITDAQAVACQAIRIRELISENIRLEREGIEQAKTIDGLRHELARFKALLVEEVKNR